MDLLLEHMIHHLGDMIDMDFSTTSTKPYSLLMTTMAELAPEVMIKQLSAILPYIRNDVSLLFSHHFRIKKLTPL